MLQGSTPKPTLLADLLSLLVSLPGNSSHFSEEGPHPYQAGLFCFLDPEPHQHCANLSHVTCQLLAMLFAFVQRKGWSQDPGIEQHASVPLKQKRHFLDFYHFCSFLFSSMLGMEHRASHRLSRYSITEFYLDYLFTVDNECVWLFCQALGPTCLLRPCPFR